MRTALRIIAVIGGIVAGAALWSDVVHLRASRRRMGRGGQVGREVVLVLGFRDRGPRANAVNRYRVRAAVRSRDARATGSTLVFSGGAAGGPVPESELMAAYARDVLGVTGRVLLETESRSTWENVRNAIPFLESAETIRIVSNSLHAEKAREYLRRQRPDLADRLAPAREHRWGEVPLMKIVAAVVGLRKLRRMDGSRRRSTDDGGAG